MNFTHQMSKIELWILLMITLLAASTTNVELADSTGKAEYVELPMKGEFLHIKTEKNSIDLDSISKRMALDSTGSLTKPESIDSTTERQLVPDSTMKQKSLQLKTGREKKSKGERRKKEIDQKSVCLMTNSKQVDSIMNRSIDSTIKESIAVEELTRKEKSYEIVDLTTEGQLIPDLTTEQKSKLKTERALIKKIDQESVGLTTESELVDLIMGRTIDFTIEKSVTVTESIDLITEGQLIHDSTTERKSKLKTEQESKKKIDQESVSLTTESDLVDAITDQSINSTTEKSMTEEELMRKEKSSEIEDLTTEGQLIQDSTTELKSKLKKDQEFIKKIDQESVGLTTESEVVDWITDQSLYSTIEKSMTVTESIDLTTEGQSIQHSMTEQKSVKKMMKKESIKKIDQESVGLTKQAELMDLIKHLSIDLRIKNSEMEEELKRIKESMTERELTRKEESVTEKEFTREEESYEIVEEPGPLRCESPRCHYIGEGFRDSSQLYYYEIDGHKIEFQSHLPRRDGLVITWGGQVLRIDCDGADILESPGLPRASPAASVQLFTLHNCPLPATVSLMTVLTRLIATLFFDPDSTVDQRSNDIIDKPRTNELTIENPPASPPLAAGHFHGLDNLQTLILTTDSHMIPEPGFLTPLRSLRTLKVTNVTLSTGDIDVLSPSLENLELFFTGLKQVPKTFRLSPVLHSINISSHRPLDIKVVPQRLEYLCLRSPATTLRLDAAPALKTIALENWVEQFPAPLTQCPELRSLHLTAPVMRALPHHWLSLCPKLEELVIENARNLISLPPKLFMDSCPLRRLALKHGVLETFPAGLMLYMRFLDSLELDDNRLRTLPEDIYRSYKLNLSSNELDGVVLRRLSSPQYLTELDLSHNPRIGDLCTDENYHGHSALLDAPALTKLLLAGTGITRICKDWRRNMPLLETLDLNNTNITSLWVHDLIFKRTVKSHVWLLGAPVQRVHMARTDYEGVVDEPPGITSVHMDAELVCDCNMYWTRRLLSRSPNVLDRVRELRCRGGLLRDQPSEDFVCPWPDQCTSLPACTCHGWALDDPDHEPELVRIRCQNASLTRVPRVLNSTILFYDLQLANNHIASLHADDLPSNLKALDLRNNSLTRVDDETATRLEQLEGALQLAGNPLECSCEGAPLLRALQQRALSGLGPADAICRDGRSPYEVSYADCTLSTKSIVA